MRSILSADSYGDFLRLGFLLAAAAIPAAIQPFVFPGTAAGQEVVGGGLRISVQSARRLTGTVLYVDARPEADYWKGHVPGAVWFDGNNPDAGIDMLLDRWNPGDILIVYCSSISCDASSDLANRLVRAGFTGVHVLEGGWKEWSGDES